MRPFFYLTSLFTINTRCIASSYVRAFHSGAGTGCHTLTVNTVVHSFVLFTFVVLVSALTTAYIPGINS